MLKVMIYISIPVVNVILTGNKTLYSSSQMLICIIVCHYYSGVYNSIMNALIITLEDTKYFEYL